MTRRQVTKPKQAASKSTLDQWQRDVLTIIRESARGGDWRRIQALAKNLLASIRRAETR